MTKRIIYLLLAVSVGLNVGVVFMTLVDRTAGPPLGPPRDGGGPGDPSPGQHPDPAQLVENHLRGMTAHLELDENQQQGIRRILERHARELITLRTGVAETSQRLSDAFAAPVFDRDGFLRLTAETSAVRSKLDSLSSVMLVAEAAVLTPAQRVQFAKVAPMMNAQRQRRSGEGGPRPNDGPRPGDRPPPR